MNGYSDFVISDGELKQYYGNEEHLVIPTDITNIGNNALQRCLSLQCIEIPGNLLSIGDYSFAFCTNLAEIMIPDSVTVIVECAFCGCRKLASVTLSGGLVAIGSRAFEGCEKLENLTIPKSVKEINEATFRWCKGLKKVVILDGTIIIKKWAFEGCSNIEIVVPEDNCLQIEEQAFSDVSTIILRQYIFDIEKKGDIKKLIITDSPMQQIKHAKAKRLAIKGFLTARDLSIYKDKTIESYQRFLKKRLLEYIEFVLEDDTEFIISRLCSLEIMDQETADILIKEDIAVAAKAALLEYRNNGMLKKDIDEEFYV